MNRLFEKYFSHGRVTGRIHPLTVNAFWIVLTLKLVSGATLAGPVFADLFMPFLEEFVAEPSQNPYETFWGNGLSDSFPYPTMMLYVMSLLRGITMLLGLEALPEWAIMLLYRVPLLIADLTILWILCQWSRRHVVLLVWLYWASPVLFYINYLHGQLDAIAIAFALLATHFLASARWVRSAALLAAAIACKMHILLLLPFALIYLWQSDRRLGPALNYLLLTIAGFCLINLPYLGTEGFEQMVLLNAQQAKVGLIVLTSGVDGTVFYIIPALILILVAYAFVARILNRDMFLFFMGSAFGALLLFIPPSPGWYYWIVPILVYFATQAKRHFLLPFALLQAFYFVFFALSPNSDFAFFLGGDTFGVLHRFLLDSGINADAALGLAFTMLQTLLLITSGWMLFVGVHRQRHSTFRARPLMIAIAGDSGAGKSTLADSIQSLFGRDIVGLICGDDMHKWERGHTEWSKFTHLNPLANELYTELDFARRLRQNRHIKRRHYDHDTGKFTDALGIRPRPVMVLEGLHAFYLKPAREVFDLKIFVKPDASLLQHRKIARDTTKRGHSKTKVIESIHARREDRAKFVEVQERHADIVVSIVPTNEITDDVLGDADYEVSDMLQMRLSNTYFIEPLVEDLMRVAPGSIRHYYDDNDRQVIEMDAPLAPELINDFGARHVEGLEFLGQYNPPWSEGWNGVIQLFVSHCIFCDWRNEIDR